jgi:hypothetical protein
MASLPDEDDASTHVPVAVDATMIASLNRYATDVARMYGESGTRSYAALLQVYAEDVRGRLPRYPCFIGQ